MNAPRPKPVAETSSTVTLRKRDWKALIARLEDLEDAAAIAERLAYEEKIGKEVARRDYLTGDELRRILDDESPVKVCLATGWSDTIECANGACPAWATTTPVSVPTSVFGLFELPYPLVPDLLTYRFAHAIHVAVAVALAMLVIFHVAAALIHALWWRDRTMMRMWRRSRLEYDSTMT